MEFRQRLDRYLKDYPAAPHDAILASRLLFRSAHLLQAHIDGVLQPFGLVMREYLALVVISADGTLRPSDLSTTLDATRTQITRLLDGLEHKGLVHRTQNHEDRRSLALALTDMGNHQLGLATPLVHSAYREAWAVLGESGEANSGGSSLGSALKQLGLLHQGLEGKR